ncbi:PCI domain-containing protein [Cardiosporidium cionae]|uniref:PCI domain-containing protein n=1 Tax=Cardiosporidium cionae TaxID=476202 RepID=A0ABQ7JEN9_9APIC|nr:PCI domain-containing protein [Cardiosporidium cionae]|eukprot:KAF8822463.1 PCI domain-containing protein [Cardiosporidium cionae]
MENGHSLTLAGIQALLEEAKTVAAENAEQGIVLYTKILQFVMKNACGVVIESPDESAEQEKPTDSMQATVEESLRVLEQTIYALALLHVQLEQPLAIQRLLFDCDAFFSILPKARTAKIVRTLIDMVALVPNSQEVQEDLCKQCISWCRLEKRTFLRLRVETRLALLYLQQGKLQKGIDLVEQLLREVKKLDDKLLLVEIHLVESKLYFTIENIAKSKAALTAARTSANAIHCPPILQGDIDVQAGMMHAQEKDCKTAFSYFFEAFEAFSTLVSSSSTSSYSRSATVEEKKALQAFKYMLLAKILCGHPEEVSILLSGKHGLKYATYNELDALKAIAKCHRERSLKMFESVLAEYRIQFDEDPFIYYHINDLYETFLEQNLIRVLEPFSSVEIDHVAKLIDLPIERVESKLAEMILDGKFLGTLDQGMGVLILFDQPPPEDLYESVLATINNMTDVVNTLSEKAQLVV